VAPDEIDLIDGYVGRGYALSRPEELELIRTVAQQEGIFLDPVYTGKAMFGLRDQIHKGRFRKGERVLFLHTGGIYGLFAREKREGLYPGKA
jgi:D-cysteine desulfhydrase